ncbi:hypothetical protein FIA56_07315 [Testudinibacter sp. TR-2022]|uniref:hypothetical protein n=3 Tax=Testudinibacter sp. TR-2022 TaxID=2585029 RepID=UPI00111B18BA|nr:hypothetical protein [Testudinibacter sp. TR-2022]TNH05207.1 hypothetical protein FHQ22_01885 [Pasteurellaceae bacterium Phil31]TNH13309.1 hypothetical protein FHQ23_12085 [Testudinibacter sp. TR-2022]TNH13463.1 hypothetical protein FIA56_07315 [Testudinibacter sp. TR-2022]
MWRIYKNNDADLNFALTCLFCQAIHLNEFREWVERVILTTAINDIPLYIYELLEFDQSLFQIYKAIGFVTDSSLSYEDEMALYGIAFFRFEEIYDSPLKKEEAFKFLKENTFVRTEFSRFFPNLKIDI